MKMWISRNKIGGLKVSIDKPTLIKNEWWKAEDNTFFHIPHNEYPEVTFENSPMEVELVLKK